jgi:hypothetical protein
LAAAEAPVEAAVSAYLGRLPVLWLRLEDEPGPESLRGFIERNVIALASGLHEPVIDPPSPSWLGLDSGRDKVRRSGLWNQRHVDEDYEPGFLVTLEAAIERKSDHRAMALTSCSSPSVACRRAFHGRSAAKA